MFSNNHDYEKQFEQELIYQEIASNRYTIKGIFWFIVAMGFVWFLTAIRFFDIDFKLATIAFGATVFLFIPSLVYFRKGDLSQKWIKYVLLALICLASGFIISTLTVHAVFLHILPLLYAIQYRKRRVIWYSFAMNTATLFFSCIAGFYLGICDLNLLFSNQHNYSWYMEQLTNNTLALTLNENHLFVIIVFQIFPHSLILLVFTILLQYSVLSNNADAVRIAKLTYLKETDIKTNLFNKNKYEEMVEAYYPKVERISVLFWDLNNLKEINDKYGHAQGDIAIEKVSAILHGYSSDRCRTYRVGGDEFLMIIDNPMDDEAETIMTNAKMKLSMQNEESPIRITSAVGLAYGTGKNIAEVVKTADKKMYQNKKFIKERSSL